MKAEAGLSVKGLREGLGSLGYLDLLHLTGPIWLALDRPLPHAIGSGRHTQSAVGDEELQPVLVSCNLWDTRRSDKTPLVDVPWSDQGSLVGRVTYAMESEAQGLELTTGMQVPCLVEGDAGAAWAPTARME